MATITIFREYNFVLSMRKWWVYANGKLVTKVGNCSLTTFTLAQGIYDLYLNFPDFPINYRKKGLHSNVIHLEVEEGAEYYFNVRPHLLIAEKKHHPTLNNLFTPVECLLLLPQDDKLQTKLNQLSKMGSEIYQEQKKFTYHFITLFLIIALSFFAIVSNIRQPALYDTTGAGIAWGFFFGISSLIGLFSGRMNKQMMAAGWEHKLLLYVSLGAFFIFISMPQKYSWQGGVFFFSIVLQCVWAYFCHKRWRLQRKGLDNLSKREEMLLDGVD